MVDLKIGPGGVTPGAPRAAPTSAGTTNADGVPSATGAGAAPAKFGETLRTVRREQLDTELSTLIGRVRDAGQKFVRDPEERNLDSYKKGVRDFLTKVQREAFAMREEPGCNKDGQQKLFQTVATIDREVADLTRETLAKEGRPLRLLASLDDIRGMLLDLVV